MASRQLWLALQSAQERGEHIGRRWTGFGALSRINLVVTIVSGLLLFPAPANTQPLPCDGGRFLVPRNVLVTGDTAGGFEAISVEPYGIESSMGCAAVKPGLRSARGGTKVSAAWPACTGLVDRTGRPARARLERGFIAAPMCDTLTGTLVVSKARPRRRHFSATRSRCGDNYLDRAMGEECGDEQTRCAPDEWCTSTCTCAPRSPSTTTLHPSSTTSTSTTVRSTTSTSTTTSPTSSTTTRPTTTSSTTTSPTTTSSTTRVTTTSTSTVTVTSTSSTTRATTSTVTSTTTVSTTSSTTTIRTTTTTTTIRPGGFTCTEVLGFSQTGMWYLDVAHGGGGTFEPLVGNGSWQLRAYAGAGVLWQDPNFAGWTSAAYSPCTQNSSNPDRILLTISTPTGDPAVSWWVTNIRAEIATIRSKYPGVRQIVLQAVVGGPNNGVCNFGGNPSNPVHASVIHPTIDQAIAQVVGGDVIAGMSPEVRSCADYLDNTGHLQVGARPAIGTLIGQFYAAF